MVSVEAIEVDEQRASAIAVHERVFDREGATELIHTAQMVMTFDGTIDVFIDSVLNFPTLSEAYKYAAYDGLGNLARITTPQP